MEFGLGVLTVASSYHTQVLCGSPPGGLPYAIFSYPPGGDILLQLHKQFAFYALSQGEKQEKSVYILYTLPKNVFF